MLIFILVGIIHWLSPVVHLSFIDIDVTFIPFRVFIREE
jgi:beta-lactamase regulating signal transducer with metallopeptidase domain